MLLMNTMPASSSATRAVARARTEVRRCNASAAYSNEKVPFGNGAMDDNLQRRTQELSEQRHSTLRRPPAPRGFDERDGVRSII